MGRKDVQEVNYQLVDFQNAKVLLFYTNGNQNTISVLHPAPLSRIVKTILTEMKCLLSQHGSIITQMTTL